MLRKFSGAEKQRKRKKSKNLFTMERIFILVAFILAGLRGLPQIIIDQTDMPNPGDTLRVSTSNIIPGDYTKTGMDTTWDFSSLFSLSQQLDSFVAKPPAFQLSFSNANLASPGGIPSFPGFPVSSPFTFYNKAAGSFADLGFGFIITFAGFPLPAAAKYDTSDKYYTFPLTTGTIWNSNSSASLGIPGLASFFRTRIRTSMVDGWGTVETPWGSFQTIRVKSHLVQRDSIFIDTLGMGVPVTRDITEYKWLAKGKGIPVLQINQEGPVSTAIYRDFYRQPIRPLAINLGPDTAVLKGSTITITANVIGGTPPYTYVWSNLALTPSITVKVDTTTRYSVVVLDAINNAGFGSRLVIAKGLGIEEKIYETLKLFPNPTDGKCYIQLSKPHHTLTLQVLTEQGFSGKEIIIDPTSPGTLEINLSEMDPGLYLLQLFDGQTWYQGKLILQSHKR